MNRIAKYTPEELEICFDHGRKIGRKESERDYYAGRAEGVVWGITGLGLLLIGINLVRLILGS